MLKKSFAVLVISIKRCENANRMLFGKIVYQELCSVYGRFYIAPPEYELSTVLQRENPGADRTAWLEVKSEENTVTAYHSTATLSRIQFSFNGNGQDNRQVIT